MKEIKRIDPMSYAKITGIVMAAIGLLMAFFFLLFGGLFASMSSGTSSGFGMAGAGIASIIIFPIMYGILGFISGLVGAIIYNAVAGTIGGVKIQFEDDEEEI